LAGKLGSLLLQTGWVARIVLLVLLLFSLFSWAVLIQKYRLFSQMRQRNTTFLQLFHSSNRLPEPKTMTAGHSALLAVYTAGYRELHSQLAAGNPHEGKIKSWNAIQVGMRLATAEEIHKMERWMPWLATTGSVTPFIGLFGTVWGVMDAFAGLGSVGAASLRAVAPGIAEALVTTAAGLFTAIPAVIGYNHFLHSLKDVAGQMNNFAAEFTARLEMQYHD